MPSAEMQPWSLANYENCIIPKQTQERPWLHTSVTLHNSQLLVSNPNDYQSILNQSHSIKYAKSEAVKDIILSLTSQANVLLPCLLFE